MTTEQITFSDRPIRAVLFDKDGTLIDFYASWVESGLMAARELCAIAQQPDQFQSLVNGSGYDLDSKRLDPLSHWAAGTTESLVRRWMAELGLDDDEELIARISELMGVEAARRITPLGDIGQVFADLRQQGMTLGVATMDLQANAHLAIQHLGVGDLLDFVCGCDSGHGLKPQAGMLLAFCRSCGLQPHEVMMVGDTPHDMGMARAAEAGVAVAVTTGASSRDDLMQLADHVIDDLGDLAALLNPEPGT
jgi:phosphoglycolate phosphatase